MLHCFSTVTLDTTRYYQCICFKCMHQQKTFQVINIPFATGRSFGRFSFSSYMLETRLHWLDLHRLFEQYSKRDYCCTLDCTYSYFHLHASHLSHGIGLWSVQNTWSILYIKGFKWQSWRFPDFTRKNGLGDVWTLNHFTFWFLHRF